MRQLKIWKFLFLLAGCSGLYFGAVFSYKLYSHFSLSKKVLASVESWEVVEVSGSKFFVSADYIFDLNSKKVSGRYLFPKPIFPNKSVAERNIQGLKNLEWDVWYRPSNPKISALQHNFPYKAAIHFALAVIVLLYFIWLKDYVSRHVQLDSA